MKLQLTHRDLELALVQYLEKQGITAFSDLSAVRATFSKVRGSEDLTVELDNAYVAPAPKPVVAKPVAAPADKPTDAPAPESAPAAPVDEPVSPVETPAETEAAKPAGDDENLFG